MADTKRKRFTHDIRRAIYHKTSRRCAYCGCKIRFKDMQVDHIQPLSNGGVDTIENMYPSCRSCNHRKGSSSVESFRKQIERSLNVLERDSVTYKNAVRYGLVIPNPHNIRFYFEKLD